MYALIKYQSITFILGTDLQHLSKQLSILVFFLSLTVSSLSSTNAEVLISSRVALEQALQKHKGKVVYLDFWASWCGPCRKSFPWMNKIEAEYKQQGFSVISVNLDANKVLAAKFLKENPASFTVIYDPKGKIAKHFKIQGMPSSMLIGRDGEIKSRHTGFFTNKISLYKQEIEQLLAPIEAMK
jgi:thiol-disulfide isomerase/thioredoxin